MDGGGEQKADVNNKRSDGITALMAAAVGGHAKVVKLLVEKGADLNEKDQEGLTALINAAEVRRSRPPRPPAHTQPTAPPSLPSSPRIAACPWPD